MERFHDKHLLLGPILDDLQNAANIICDLPASSYATLSDELTQTFPKDAQSFLESKSAAVLSNLNNALSGIDPAIDMGSFSVRKMSPDECWRAVVLARPVLKEIARMRQISRWYTDVDIPSKPFTDIGLKIPSSTEELLHIETLMLEHQKHVLECYLAWCRHPVIANHIRRNFQHAQEAAEGQSSTDGPEAHQPAGGVQRPITKAAAVVMDDRVNTYPPLRPAKALFHFETAEGFGDWAVYITPSATTDLRQLRKRSPVLFRKTVTTIRELSHGDFSAANYVLFSGTEAAVPIFKARVANDLRLLYSVDCVPDPEAEVDRQAIRIFAVCTTAQLYTRKTFWNNVAKDLGRQGEMYRDRCRQRSQPRHIGGNTYTPLTFPTLPQREDPSDHAFLLPAPASEADDAEIISMSRFHVLSQAVLHSVLADFEVPFIGRPSPPEMKVIEHDASCFVIGRSGTGKTLTMMYKIVAIMRGWELWDSERAKPRLMFVTRSSMLADHVHDATLRLLEAFRLAGLTTEELERAREQHAQSANVTDGERRRGLPKRWSALEDKHFPLFVTVDELYTLFEAELAPSVRAQNRDEPDMDVGDESLLSSVSGNRFVKVYWPRLPQPLTKGFDPMTVFSEFLGVIKGSEDTAGAARGYLDRQAYTSLSKRSYPTFATQRDRVYDMFEVYLRLKRDRQELDGADRAHALFRHLQSSRLPGIQVEFLFVDEVQDNMIVDLLLLRSLCSNPNGLFWAGDTAQTIAVGSSFTFNELTAMLHRLEERQGNSLQVPPTTFHLSNNYRSHSGIANCAQTIVDLLTTHWPNSVDRLSPEHGWRPGPRPVFFGSLPGTNGETLFDRRYTPASKLTLGSEQCIIVRDEAAQEAFRTRDIASGLVLTIYQSKGQEFDDVILYHLFEDCMVSPKQWRMLCERKDTATAVWAEDSRSLKMIYVALTRARRRLWIVDGSVHALPMIDLWTRLGVIENRSGEDTVPSLAGELSADDWVKRGQNFMDSREFALAQDCFERAGLTLERDIAAAYSLQETADCTVDYSVAAEAFRACAAKTSVADRAMDLFLACATCYHRIGNFGASAEAYGEAREFTKCAEQYIKASMWEQARQVVLRHRKDIRSDVVFEEICMHLFHENEHPKALEMFSNEEEAAVRFMKDHPRLHPVLASYYLDLRRVEDAVEVYLTQLHDVPSAVKVLFDTGDSHMVERGTQVLLKELWRRLSLGLKVADLRRQNPDTGALLALASTRISNTTVPCKGAENELVMFIAIGERDFESLLRLGLDLSSTIHQEIVAMALDFAFTFLLDERHPLGHNMLLVSKPSYLHALSIYTKVLMDYENTNIWKVYGLHKASGQSYFLPRFSMLHNDAVALPVSRTTQISHNGGGSDSGYYLSTTSVIKLLRSEIGTRIRRRVRIVSDASLRLDTLRLCVPYAYTGQCPRSMHARATCGGVHFPIASNSHPLDEHGFHVRLRIHAQIILVHGFLKVSEDDDDSSGIWEARMSWIDSFLSTVYPPFFELGNLLTLIPERVPELKDALRVLRSWICDILFAARPQFLRKSGRISGKNRIRAIPRTALLSYALDRLQDHLRDASSLPQATLAPPFAWYSASYAIVTDKLHEYSREHESGRREMPGALLYLRFLLDRGETRFHGGIMSHLAEGLCTAFILSDWARSNKLVLHNLILTRRWIANLADLWTTSHQRQWHDWADIEELLSLYPTLLECLSVAAAVSAEVESSSTVIVESLNLLCKGLFHLGCWHSRLKGEANESRIVNILAGTPDDSPRPTYLNRDFSQYVRPWNALKGAIYWSTSPRREWDQLVRLQDTTIRQEHAGRPPPGRVVPVNYDSLDDLLSRLILPDKPYKSTPFPKDWLQARTLKLQPPSSDIQTHEDASLL